MTPSFFFLFFFASLRELFLRLEATTESLAESNPAVGALLGIALCDMAAGGALGFVLSQFDVRVDDGFALVGEGVALIVLDGRHCSGRVGSLDREHEDRASGNAARLLGTDNSRCDAHCGESLVQFPHEQELALE